MGFSITEIRLQGFRNHSFFELGGLSGDVVIVGPNATGKSSLLEAVQLLSGLDSFRTSDWQDLVQWGAETCRLYGSFTDAERVIDAEMTVVQGKREYLFNGKHRRLSEMSKTLPVVLFTPEDLSLVKGAAERRRLYVDGLGKRLSSQYYQTHSDYSKTVRQRNALLKERQKSRRYDSPPTPEELAWDERLIGSGAPLTVYRYRLLTRLMERASEHYRALSDGEELDATYVPSFYRGKGHGFEGTPDVETVREQLVESLGEKRREEYLRGLSLIGPHRDEIDFSIDGQEARGFASQGQQRSIALVMKVSELDMVKDTGGGGAILLLDDVLSELDGGRRERLLMLCGEATQSFITTTDLSSIPKDRFESSTVIELTRSQ